MDVTIVGNAGGTNVGDSLHRAALRLGLTSRLLDARAASAGSRLARTLSWRVFGHRPLRLNDFSRSVVEQCRSERPRVLVTTGLAPVRADSLEEIASMGVALVNYSTDDPWNPAFRSQWFMKALGVYDRVYSPRRSNCQDFVRHGCKDVRYLPFGYDEELWLGDDRPADLKAPGAQVFFAGAADKFRLPYMRALLSAGVRVALAGDYWTRYGDLAKCAVGHLSAQELRAYTRSVPVSLCLVRHANRDGHVMRSFEIPAIGACMIAEDTAEHREIFGVDGVAVRYFKTPAQAASIARELVRDDDTRKALAGRAHALIVNSKNSYRDRLRSLLPEGVDSGNEPNFAHALSTGNR